ncbi:MAG: NADPH-dependent F420 reductase [Chloroflexota bacterium]
MTRIAIIGTGRMACGLASGWTRAGHSVTVGSRDPGANKTVGADTGAVVTTHAKALEGADVVVIAVPFAHTQEFASANAAALRGKVVIDISNPMGALEGAGKSGAQVTEEAIGEGARVVPAFKSNFFDTLSSPHDATGLVRDVLYAGNDASAKEVTADLISDLGFRPVDCGTLKAARVLDDLVPLIIDLDKRMGNHRSASWKVLG